MKKIERPSKLRRVRIRKRSFYMVETIEERGLLRKRFICWSPRPRRQRRLFRLLVESYSPTVEVLLEQGVLFDRRLLGWKRFTGARSKEFVLETLDDFESYIFKDGGTRLCVHDETSGEYVAIDGRGAILVFGAPDLFEEVLERLGFEHRRHDYLPRRRTRPSAGEESERKFLLLVDRLDLVSYDGEVEQ